MVLLVTMANYKCYGCGDVFEFSELSFECMCEHEEPPTSRGVCKACAESKKPLNIEDPQNHHLRKIHQFSEESKQFWEDMEKKFPCWGGFSWDKNDQMVFTGINFPEGIKNWDEMKAKFGEEAAHELAYAAPEIRRKTMKIPITYDEFSSMCRCTCCH